MKITDVISVEAFIVDTLAVETFNMVVPQEWEKYKKDWCDEVPPGRRNDAQILLAGDRALLHPYDEMGADKLPIHVGNARLKRSALTGKLLAFGFNIWKRQTSIQDLGTDHHCPEHRDF